MFFGRNFQNCWNGSVVVFQYMSNIVGYMLIDEDDSNVISLGKRSKGILDLWKLSVLFDNQEIGTLSISVSNTGQQKPSDGVLRKKYGK